jgi:uncharacterized protein (TIGR03435 family)
MPLRRRFLLAALSLPSLLAQESVAPLKFEVVSVKPVTLPPGRFFFRSGDAGPRVSGDSYTANPTTLEWLLMDAYNVKDYQIAGLPKWATGANADHFNVAAKAERQPTLEQLRQMLQSLLAERFHLKFHREMRPLPAYVLVVSPGGHKMRKMADDEKVPTYASTPPVTARMMGPFSGLVNLIAMSADHPVIDKTGLTGNYDAPPMDWTALIRAKRADPQEDGVPSLTQALQSELGLKLEARKEPLEVLVIDSVEKPSAN